MGREARGGAGCLVVVERAGECGLDDIQALLRDAGAVAAAPIDEDICAGVFDDPRRAAAALARFRRPPAVGAAPAVWRRIAAHPTPRPHQRVRQPSTADHATADAMNRCRHILDVAHDGQIIASAAVASWTAAEPGLAEPRDLGVHRLRDLGPPERLVQLAGRDPVPADAPAIRSLSTLPNNLPVQLTGFVGRRSGQARVIDLMARYRMVTLSGQGGVGKTRLALQVAAAVIDRWRDGVWVADLGEARSLTEVAKVLAEVLAIPVNEAKDPLETVVSRLESAEMLVVLDTCEPALRGACVVAERLLASCPGVGLLCTSREPVRARGEVVWTVRQLDAVDAAALFTRRADLARPGIANQLEPVRVEELCDRLDSLPLAIELAAAWVRTLSLPGILRGLDERFRLLTGGPWQSEARHQAMRASIDWSYELLAPDAQVLFRRLSVFRSSFAVEAAAAVCPDEPADTAATFQAVRQLVDKSLVLPTDEQWGTRYRLLDTLRDYGDERLDRAERERLRARHLSWCARHAEACDAGLDRNQLQWVRVLNQDRDNLHAALEWGLAADRVGPTCRLTAALSRYWFVTGQSGHALPVLTKALELAGDEPGDDDLGGIQCRLWAGIAMLAMISGRRATAVDAAKRGEQVAAASGDAIARARCLAIQAYDAFYFDFAECERLSQAALDAGRAAEDGFASRLGWLLLACSHTNRDRHDRAAAIAAELAEHADEHNDRFIGSFAQAVQMWAAIFQGDVARAVELGRESLRRCEPLRDYFSTGTNTAYLAWALGLHGRADDGLALMSSVVRSLEEGGAEADAVSIEVVMGKLHWWAGNYRRAKDWLERSLEFNPANRTNWIAAQTLPPLSAVLRELGEADESRTAALAGVDSGRAMGMPHATADALDQLATLALDADPARALEHTIEALQLRLQWRLRTFYVDSLRLLAANPAYGDPLARARLAAAAQGGATVGYLARSPADQARDRVLHQRLRSALGEEEFERAWREGSALGLDDAAAYVLRAHAPRGRKVSTGWESLTPMERQVAVLVAQGLTNPQVAEKLFVSRTTVKTHLARSFSKLGISSRTQLARIVARGGHG
ncbi:LuxR family transcriptional regulator [Prauserella shujinwangii]|uniref:LuxR family transcriptional regulator n=1 Tax=Prauserella shujinwangii TaxID=1453103 RepID=A0A2T0LTH4_9PSEU|nr:LuxR C-terminal-related transcriptional regulator [Prauserella shujinwangii]PRX46994.1 LuxR family transcriptional regulator [Prauserella shujinwangii]